MNKHILFSMGLLACLAFSPPPASAAPNTGPKVDNIEEVVDNTTASANLIMPEQGVFQVSITNSYFSAFAQASGQETVVVHRSDHSVISANIDDFSMNLNEKVSLDSESEELVKVDKYDGVHPQVWFDGRSRASNMQVSINENFKEKVFGVASMATLRSHQLVRVMKRPAWTESYCLRC